MVRVNGNGTGLQAYALFPANYYSYVANLGISGDGSKVFYEVATNAGPWELGVLNWDGSGKRVLDSGVGGGNTASEVVQLTHDGSKLSYGSLDRLYNTDGSGVLQLAATGPLLDNDPPLMVGNWGLYRSSMNRDATRFLFTFDNNTWVGGVKQPGLVAVEQLEGHGALFVQEGEQMQAARVGGQDLHGVDEGRIAHSRAEAAAQDPERKVRESVHRRQDHVAVDRDVPDEKGRPGGVGWGQFEAGRHAGVSGRAASQEYHVAS